MTNETNPWSNFWHNLTNDGGLLGGGLWNWWGGGGGGGGGGGDSPGPVTPPTGQQPNSRPGYDFFSTQTPNYTGGGLPRGARFRITGRYRKLVGWELEIWDTRGGLNRTVADYENDWDKASSSTLDTRHYRTLALPPLTTVATSPDPATNLRGLHSVNCFDVLLIGVGGDNDVSHFKETSATDPTIAAITGVGAGRPGDEIISLSKAVIGGATLDERVIMGLQGAAALVVGDASGTVDATMDASTAGLWGAIQTPLNDERILFYANGVLSYLDKTQAATTAPTTILSNVPQGGYALGLLQLGGGFLRAYWVWPRETTTAGILTFGAEKHGRLIHTNVEGTDPQELKLFPKGVLQAGLVPSRSGIVAHDGFRSVFHDGRTISDLLQFADREPNSDREFRIRNMWIDDPAVYFLVNYIASPSGTGNTQEWIECYNFATGTWHQVTSAVTLGTTGVQSVLSAGSAPISLQNRFLHRYSNGAWRRVKMEQYGYNPYTMARQSSGAQSSTGSEFEASGTWKSPYWELPGLRGYPKIVSEILCLGDIDAGGTAATAASVSVTAGGVTAAFTTGHPYESQGSGYKWNQSAFYQLKVEATVARTTNSTRFTPNALPIIVRGFALLDPLMPLNDTSTALRAEIERWMGQR